MKDLKNKEYMPQNSSQKTIPKYGADGIAGEIAKTKPTKFYGGIAGKERLVKEEVNYFPY